MFDWVDYFRREAELETLARLNARLIRKLPPEHAARLLALAVHNVRQKKEK